MFFLIPPVAIFAALYVALRAVKRGVKPSRAVKRHVLTLIMATVALIALTVAVSAASETTNTGDAAAVTAQSDSAKGLGLLAAGLSTGLAGIGGGIALAGGTPAAIGATSEDPKNFSKSLIFVALGETIALYGIVISVMILSRL
jgi:ATP synthase subunit C.